LKRDNIFGARRTLEEHDDQVPGIQLRFLPKRVLPDNAFPFFGRAHEKIDLDAELLLRFRFQKALELRTRPRSASEHDVSALEERSDVIESKLREEVAQVGHADAAVSADVDGAEQRDMSCQIDQ
jgi:hypothetical protein